MTKWITTIGVIVAFFTPYTLGWDGAWWKFLPATAAILLLWWWRTPNSFMNDLGFRFSKQQVITGLALFIIVFFIADWLIPALLSPVGYIPGPYSSHLGWKYLAVFQALNEEMILRALLLTALLRLCKNRILLSIIAATIFAFLHYVLYRFGKQDTALSINALITLFLFGIACNSLYLSTKSIIIPYVIHVGWNITRFGSDWILADRSTRLSEATGFNLIEGNLSVVAFAALLATVGLGYEWYYARRFTPGSSGLTAKLDT